MKGYGMLVTVASTNVDSAETPSISLSFMGKGKKGTGVRSGQRTRLNPLTGERETVSGTKAGKKRFRLSYGDPLRTHDKPKRHSSDD
jgi:hypothetical protein